MDRRIRKSKASFKKSLIHLMYQKNVTDITISELCTLADLNRSTFYSNYANITDLLSDIHKDLFMEMHKETLQQIENGEIITDTYNLIYNSVKYIENHKDVVKILFLNNMNNLLQKNLVNFFLKKYLPETNEFSEIYSFAYHTMGGYTLLYQWVIDGFPCSSKELTDIINEQAGPLIKISRKN